MTTEDFLELLEKAWAWLKKFHKFVMETHFTCWEDFIYFCVLYGSLIAIVILTGLIAYQYGWDAGETAGLAKGFINGQKFNAP